MRIQEVILENVLAVAREDFTDTIIALGLAQKWLGMLDARARIQDYKYYLALYPYHGSDSKLQYSISLEVGSAGSSTPILHQPVGSIAHNGTVGIVHRAGGLLLNPVQRKGLATAAKTVLSGV